MHAAALRCYPRGLGFALLRLYDRVKDKPRLDLRQKVGLNPALTDLEIFQNLPLGDPWVDAQVPGLFLYLLKNPNLVIPDGWQVEMAEMKAQMEQLVSRME